MIPKRQLRSYVCWHQYTRPFGKNLLMDKQVIQRQFGLTNSVLFPVPVPEEYEKLGEILKIHVDQAIAESEANGMNQAGQKVTPWLLNRISELSSGDSIKSSMSHYL
jgi:pseudouridine-5'-phosphate glycosidase